jgi:hypothetical protein
LIRFQGQEKYVRIPEITNFEPNFVKYRDHKGDVVEVQAKSILKNIFFPALFFP